ncbi:hypothetical protein G6F68_019447 [Rhizopus microsporus]|nr:hypothetical protein G6F68_019447 [Rhizopus microsporus]
MTSRIADAQPAAVVADDVLHGRVLEHQLAVLVDLGLHDLEREPVVATHEADQLAGILHRQKALGGVHIQVDVQADDARQQQQRQSRMAQHTG